MEVKAQKEILNQLKLEIEKSFPKKYSFEIVGFGDNSTEMGYPSHTQGKANCLSIRQKGILNGVFNQEIMTVQLGSVNNEAIALYGRGYDNELAACIKKFMDKAGIQFRIG